MESSLVGEFDRGASRTERDAAAAVIPPSPSPAASTMTSAAAFFARGVLLCITLLS